MTVTSTSTATVISRQNSIQNEVFTEEGLENQVAISRSSSSTPSDDKPISLLTSQGSEETVQEEPELTIVKVVKGIFHSLASFFQRTNTSEEPASVSEKEPELEEENEAQDPSQSLVKAIKQEPESAEYESQHVDLVALRDSQSEDVSDTLEQKSSSLDTSHKNETISYDQNAEIAPIVSGIAADEKRALSDNQQYILKDLKQELKDFFNENCYSKKIIKILNKAEVHYCAILNSNLRRYKGLDADDKVSLALQNSRAFLSSMYQKIKK